MSLNLQALIDRKPVASEALDKLTTQFMFKQLNELIIHKVCLNH